MAEKAAEIETYCGQLEHIVPRSFEDYAANFEKRAACERFFEKIVEAAVDLAYLNIREFGLRTPVDDKEAFTVLAEAGIITTALGQRLQDAKGMRNFIAHEYGRLDDRLVFQALKEFLLDDMREFLQNLQKRQSGT